MMVLLQAMQGLGKPGRTIWGTTMGAPANTSICFPGYAEPKRGWASSKAADRKMVNPTKQRLYRLTLPDAILDPPIEWDGDGFCGQSLEQQFTHHVYPMEGYPEVKMFYRYGGTFMGTMADTSKWVSMYQSPKLEFVVNQDCWWGSETGFADIILPACTNLERDDISERGRPAATARTDRNGNNFRVIVRMKKCIEPLWESKSDYEILTLLAERLGMKDHLHRRARRSLTGRRSSSSCRTFPSLSAGRSFEKKGYYIINPEEDHKTTPALRWFAEGRPCDTPDPVNKKRGTDKGDELGTYSGKIEFVSQSFSGMARRRRAAASPPPHPELGGVSGASSTRNIPFS